MDPQTGLEGKFSISFTAAAQIVFGQVTIETFTDENVKNPQVQYLLKRMELVANDEFTPSRGGKATIYFKDGTIIPILHIFLAMRLILMRYLRMLPENLMRS